MVSIVSLVFTLKPLASYTDDSLNHESKVYTALGLGHRQPHNRHGRCASHLGKWFRRSKFIGQSISNKPIEIEDRGRQDGSCGVYQDANLALRAL